jgi:iron complex outermembrane receptor protein
MIPIVLKKTARLGAALLIAGLAVPRQVRADKPEDLAQVPIEQLLDVEITTASRTPSRLESAPGIVTVISQQDILNMGARTLGDVLNVVPGFTVGRALQGGFHTSLYVRGAFSLNAENVLILVNGKRLNDGITGGGLSFLPDLPLDDVRQIEVIRGPGSALYGANAFVGVVNIVTLGGRELQGGRLAYRGGNLDGHYTTAEYGRASGKMEYALHGSFTHYDDRDLPQADIHRLVSDAQAPGINQLFADRVNSEAVRMFNAGGTFKYGGFTLEGGYNTSKDANNWLAGASLARRGDAYRNHFDTDNGRVAASFSQALGRSASVDLTGAFDSHASTSRYTWENVAAVAGTLPVNDDVAKGAYILEDWRTETLEAEASTTLRPSDAHTLVAGVAFQRDHTRAAQGRSNLFDTDGNGSIDSAPAGTFRTVTSLPKNDRTIYAGYGQYAWSPSQRLTLTGGVRGDHYDDFGSTVNPRFAAVVEPTQKLTVKALAARAFRAPSIQELRRTVNGAVVPNPTLDPEHIATYEVQLNYRLRPALSLSASGFLYEISDVIRQVSAFNPRAPQQATWRNLGTRRSRGLELEARYQPRRTVSAFANFSLARATDRSGGSPVPVAGVPRQSLNFGASAEVLRRLTVGVTGDVRWGWTPQPAIPAASVGGSPVFLFPELPFPSYAVVNAHLAWRDVLPRITFSADAFNIFDAKQVFPEQHAFAPGGITANSRQLLFGAQMRF